ncbi:MAG: thioredoxin family protein [Desulfovibrio sp.]|uniref:thioredoxin family protein n=1 Tax=Desulfovibrio sp. 7SRBS1 TaxID=3378064 RepID=UPI003B41E1B9
MSAIHPLTDQASLEFFAGLDDAIVFFHKDLCPHCKNMEKVLEKFSAKAPDVQLFSVDSEKHADLMETLSFERVPTLVFVRSGQVATVKSGLMNPRELKALYASL